MRFFEKERPQVYIHAAKLKRDKKTGKRLWQFTLIVTMNQQLVESCGVPVAKACEYIRDKDAAAFDVYLVVEIAGCTIDFFAEVDDAAPVLHLEGVDLTGLRFVRDAETVEFWFSGEHVNEGGIHDFMKPYAYSRVWAAFTPQQRDLPIPANKEEELKQAILPALDRFAQASTRDGTTLTLQVPGREPVVIDKAAADRICAARKASKKKRQRDPG